MIETDVICTPTWADQMGYANQRVFRSVKLGTLLWRWISRNHKITTLHWIISPSLSLTSVCMVSVQLYPTGWSFCSLTEHLYFISMLFHLLIELVDPNSQPLLRTAKYVIHALCIVKVYSLGFLHVICIVLLSSKWTVSSTMTRCILRSIVWQCLVWETSGQCLVWETAGQCLVWETSARYRLWISAFSTGLLWVSSFLLAVVLFRVGPIHRMNIQTPFERHVFISSTAWLNITILFDI